MVRNNQVRVSDVITAKEIQKWKPGDIVTITAECGAGKTHFIMNTLYDYAKENGLKILILLRNENLFHKIEQNIRGEKRLHIETIMHAKVQDYYSQTKEFYFENYNYNIRC